MTDRQLLKKSLKKAILKLKNGSASSEEISDEMADAIEVYVKGSKAEQSVDQVS